MFMNLNAKKYILFKICSEKSSYAPRHCASRDIAFKINYRLVSMNVSKDIFFCSLRV